MCFRGAVNQGHASLAPYSPTFFPLHCLQSKNEIVKNYITAIPIKTANAMRFCWKNIKYVTSKQHSQAWDFQPYGWVLLLWIFIPYYFRGTSEVS